MRNPGRISSSSAVYLSPIVLHDGLLSSIQIETLNLQGTQLVNLTACEAGLGEVEADGDVLGFVERFLFRERDLS